MRIIERTPPAVSGLLSQIVPMLPDPDLRALKLNGNYGLVFRVCCGGAIGVGGGSEEEMRRRRRHSKQSLKRYKQGYLSPSRHECRCATHSYGI